MAGYLQGRFVKSGVCSATFSSYAGSWTNTAVAFSDGASFASTDEILSTLAAALSGWSFAVDKESGKIVASSPGTQLKIAFSTSGDGDDLRDFLGEAGDVSPTATPYTFTSAHEAGFYPERTATQFRRTSTAQLRAARLLGDKTGETQFGPESDTGQTQIELEILTSTTAENAALETFFDEVYAAQGEPFSYTHTDELAHSVICADSPNVLEWRRLSPKLNSYWQVSLSLWSI